jgi:PAS domain S-box-containing protein
VSSRPITEAARETRAARRLAAIVESSDDAIISKDVNGIITSWNRAAERMFGYNAAEMVGESIHVIIPDDRRAEEDDVLAHIRNGEKVDHFETLRRRKDGTLIPISLTVSPILDDHGGVVGASKIARDISERRQAEQERTRLLNLAQEHASITEKLNQVGSTVTSALDIESVVQAVTDAATDVTNAEFGAFFSRGSVRDGREGYELRALSGASVEGFSKLPRPGATALLGPTFRGESVIRVEDVTRDPRYGLSEPFHGVPNGHVAVRSYLATPVRARSGEVLGALLFGHSRPGMFTAQHERLIVGISSWASLALENARLYVGVQEASRLKDEFLATLSHELRTPLNAILGYARMIRAGLMTGEKQTRAVETIERNATSLTQIVEDVLDVSRIISGKIRLNVQPVDLSQVVREALEAVMPAANAKGVRVETVIDPRAAPISADPERLQQVIWNLAANAVKFTSRGGTVQVRLERVDSHVDIIVSDTGIGIRPEFLPHVFERFRQADSGTTRERGGLGLGLAIARHFVEMHGGTISVSSDGENKGSTFGIQLPLMVVQPETAEEVHAHPHLRGADGRIPVPHLQGVHVLAVDDDRDSLRMVREILEAAGAEVSTADSAIDAIETLQHRRPHVLVADLGLPHIDGFELVSRIRQHPDLQVRDIPAAALTAYARSEDRAKALRSGFQIHLAKPIDPGELMAAIATLVRRTR